MLHESDCDRRPRGTSVVHGGRPDELEEHRHGWTPPLEGDPTRREGGREGRGQQDRAEKEGWRKRSRRGPPGPHEYPRPAMETALISFLIGS